MGYQLSKHLNNHKLQRDYIIHQKLADPTVIQYGVDKCSRVFGCRLV